jgi:two-component system, OmpR family, sensor kinase
MSGIRSRIERWWIELAWIAWIAINVAAAVLVPSGETIPFHFIWLSLALVYGIRLWSFGTTLWILLAICFVSGVALSEALVHSHQGLDEAAEVPMMGAMFLAMVWFASRWKTAVDELSRASARERDFVRDASHQLRTPITVARGHLELVRDELPDTQTVEDIDIVLGELDRLARISDRLLILATAEYVGFVARAPVNLSRVLAASARRWRSTVPREWTVSVRAHGTLVGDEERIEAALDALIENAIKATDAGDRIAIELHAEGDCAVIEVADTGRGLAKEDLLRVFDRFWRASESGARVNGGTGLGLAIVKAIAEAHGGSAQASLNPDGGATFRMSMRGFVPLLWPMVPAAPAGVPGGPRRPHLEAAGES